MRDYGRPEGLPSDEEIWAKLSGGKPMSDYPVCDIGVRQLEDDNLERLQAIGSAVLASVMKNKQV